jgi:hypothetical protein
VLRGFLSWPLCKDGKTKDAFVEQMLDPLFEVVFSHKVVFFPCAFDHAFSFVELFF